MNLTTKDNFDTFVAQFIALEKDVIASQVDWLVARFRQGRIVSLISKEARYGDESVIKFADAVRKSKAYCYESKLFYEYPLWQQSTQILRSWAGEQIKMRGELFWYHVRELLHISDKPADKRATEDFVRRKMYSLEKRAARLEEEASELEGWAKRLDIPDDLREQAVGVIQQARQVEVLPYAKEDTPRNDDYLRFVGTHACWDCGAAAPSDPHHTETGGTGLKGSDYSAVPLCRRCHDATGHKWHPRYALAIALLLHEYVTGTSLRLPLDVPETTPYAV